MKYELGEIWKEAIDFLKILFQHLPGETEDYGQNSSLDSGTSRI
jgi:hypothetical protein